MMDIEKFLWALGVGNAGWNELDPYRPGLLATVWVEDRVE